MHISKGFIDIQHCTKYWNSDCINGSIVNGHTYPWNMFSYHAGSSFSFMVLSFAWKIPRPKCSQHTWLWNFLSFLGHILWDAWTRKEIGLVSETALWPALAVEAKAKMVDIIKERLEFYYHLWLTWFLSAFSSAFQSPLSHYFIFSFTKSMQISKSFLLRHQFLCLSDILIRRNRQCSQRSFPTHKLARSNDPSYQLAAAIGICLKLSTGLLKRSSDYDLVERQVSNEWIDIVQHDKATVAR